MADTDRSREDHATDVLVIGSGAAGIRAAIEAHETRAKVVLVTKSKVPSGCSVHAMGLIQAASQPGDTTDIHFADTIAAGQGLNDHRLVGLLVSEALQRVRDLEKYGTEFLFKDGEHLVFPTAGCTYPRAFMTARPYAGGFMEGLVKELRSRDIEFVENCMITKLLRKGEQVVGAIGFDREAGVFRVFSAKSTILATGGAGEVYSLTTNPVDVTGDGYAMAYEAGVQLMDMEFIQFRACVVYPASMRGQAPPEDGLVTIGGRFYNGLGERYMKKYDHVRIERVTRDVIAICAHKEIKDGRGTPHGGVYNDLSGVPEDELKRFNRFLGACKAEGIDPSWQPIEWAPGAHYFMGGVRINHRCETDLAGLYAVGEVTSGIHGANRLAGNALAETQVLGARGGKFAAERALQVSNAHMPDEKQVETEMNKLGKIMESQHGREYGQMREDIRSMMTRSVGVARSEHELEEALRRIERLKRERFSVGGEARSLTSLAEAIESINLLCVAEMIIRSALLRKESRGAHYREDNPARIDDLWLRNTVLWREGEEMRLQRASERNRPIVMLSDGDS